MRDISPTIVIVEKHRKKKRQSVYIGTLKKKCGYRFQLIKWYAIT